MKKLIYTLLILILPLIAYNKVNFYKGSLNDVKINAAEQGKLYFVDFYASYCLPCKLMDQTTFMDEELGSYVAQNYIPLKLNIDAFDAYEIRADYEVQELPTIMIFSSSGILLDTYKGSLTATALRKLLKKHDLPENRQLATPPEKEVFEDEAPVVVAKPKLKPRPSKPEPSVPSNDIVVPTKPIRKAKPIITNTETTSNSDLNMPIIISKPKPTTKPSKPIISNNGNNNTVIKPISPEKNISTFKPTTIKKIIPQNTVTTIQPEPKKGSGLYEFTSKKHPSNGFGIQIGLFAEYGNVLTEVEKIQAKFSGKKVLVHITEFQGKVVYRVMVGTFTSYALARNYLPQVKANGFEAFIKDLSILN